jgi:hypothetical protein
VDIFQIGNRSLALAEPGLPGEYAGTTLMRIDAVTDTLIRAAVGTEVVMRRRPELDTI